MDNIDYTHDTYFVCKEIRWVFNIVPLCCVTHMSHAIYTAVSL